MFEFNINKSLLIKEKKMLALWLIMILIALWQVSILLEKKQYKYIMVFLALWIIAGIYGSLVLLGINIPSPFALTTDIIDFIRDLILDFL